MDQLELLMFEYPIIRNIMILMIVSRVVFKTIFTILAKYVELTVEDTEDNEKLERVLTSKWYKLSAFILDLTLSIKLPSKKKMEK
jgi:hypothetical protein